MSFYTVAPGARIGCTPAGVFINGDLVPRTSSAEMLREPDAIRLRGGRVVVAGKTQDSGVVVIVRDDGVGRVIEDAPGGDRVVALANDGDGLVALVVLTHAKWARIRLDADLTETSRDVFDQPAIFDSGTSQGALGVRGFDPIWDNLEHSIHLPITYESDGGEIRQAAIDLSLWDESDGWRCGQLGDRETSIGLVRPDGRAYQVNVGENVPWQPHVSVENGRPTVAISTAAGAFLTLEDFQPWAPPLMPAIGKRMFFGWIAFGAVGDAPRNCEMQVVRDGSVMVIQDLDGHELASYAAGDPDSDLGAVNAAIARNKRDRPDLPCWVYWTRKCQVEHPEEIPTGADRWLVEAYRLKDEPVGDYEARVRAGCRRVPAAGVIPGCYTSNDANTKDLRSVPPVIARVARDEVNVDVVLAFSAGPGRATGWNDHPEVHDLYRELFLGVTGMPLARPAPSPPIETPPQTPTVPDHPAPPVVPAPATPPSPAPISEDIVRVIEVAIRASNGRDVTAELSADEELAYLNARDEPRADAWEKHRLFLLDGRLEAGARVLWQTWDPARWVCAIDPAVLVAAAPDADPKPHLVAMRGGFNATVFTLRRGELPDSWALELAQGVYVSARKDENATNAPLRYAEGIGSFESFGIFPVNQEPL